MENSTNKAIVIAVGIFVTVAITSGILFSINEMKNIYSQVYETDTSITSRFSEFDAFDGTIVTGVDVINAKNKYGDKVEINSTTFGGTINLNDEDEKMKFYSLKFKATLDVTDEKIIFEEQ